MNIIKATSAVLFVLFIGLFAGCNHHIENDGDIDPELAQELWQKHMDALRMNDADSQCVAKINDLAFSMLHQIGENLLDSSFIVSPLGLASVIAISGNGAQDGTRDEIELVVGPIAKANAFFKKYSDALPHNDYTDCQLLNYLAINSAVPIKDEFLKSVSSNYNACAKNLDFANVKSVKQVNKWFSRQSKDKLTTAIDELDPESALYVIDALLYNALWAQSFDKENTENGDFITDYGDTLLLPMMYNYYTSDNDISTQTFYCEGEDYQAVALPYGGGCYRMLVVLPKSAKLREFIASMDREKYTRILNTFQMAQPSIPYNRSKDKEFNLSLYLPRFECDSKLNMTDFVKKMMPRAFDFQKADFSAISKKPTMIHDIRQMTNIQVTELKTKAVSITVSEQWIDIGLEDEPIQELIFNANHPFLYFVYDEQTHAILLMGQFCGDGAIFD